MLQYIRESTVFVRQFGSCFETTGSIVPSSTFLAKAMTRKLAARSDSPIRVLECGPGTGVVTGQIIEHLRPGDRLDLVELNENFVAALHRRLDDVAQRSRDAVSLTIHQLPFQQFESDEEYDFIISGLPHINFPAQTVQEITECYDRLLKPGGSLSYFEYMYIRPIRTVATLGVDRSRVKEVDVLMNDLLGRYESSRDDVFLNIPPAWVRHLSSPAEIDARSDETRIIKPQLVPQQI